MTESAPRPKSGADPATGPITRTLPIINQKGLHARASARLVECVERFDAQAWVEREGVRVPGDSIMGLLTLVAACGTSITVTTEGPQAAALADAIRDLLASRFGEGA